MAMQPARWWRGEVAAPSRLPIVCNPHTNHPTWPLVRRNRVAAQATRPGHTGLFPRAVGEMFPPSALVLAHQPLERDNRARRNIGLYRDRSVRCMELE